MRVKDDSVECEFHPIFNAFLWAVDAVYVYWGDELVITSGSELDARHSYTSLHYAGAGADGRFWSEESHDRAQVPSVSMQMEILKDEAREFCRERDISADWIEVIEESDHIHYEYQPKRKS